MEHLNPGCYYLHYLRRDSKRDTYEKSSRDFENLNSSYAMAQQKSSPATWCMFPLMHDNVSSLLAVDGLHFTFHPIDEDTGSIKNYDSNIMGLFRCYNPSCKSKGWGSKKIAITIRMYPSERYNARVYYQRCKKCDRLSKPKVDDSYAERVAYRLKKWRGVKQEAPLFLGKSKKPHERNLCEGCKAGHCSEEGDVDTLVDGFSNFLL